MTSPKKRSRSSGEECISQGRILAVQVVFACAALLVIWRCLDLQIFRGEYYRSVAHHQSSRSSRLRAERGMIKDCHGMELAVTVNVDSVFADPKEVVDVPGVAAALSPLLGVSKAILASRLVGERRFVYLKRRVDSETAEKVRSLNAPGIAIVKEPKRFYPRREALAHVLGFTNVDGIGKLGIERQYDDVLRGGLVDVTGLRDARGRMVFHRGLVPTAALEGDDLVLSIDSQVQSVSEEVLKSTVQSFGAKSGVAIVLDPNNGEIIALANYPTFNPNNLVEKEADFRFNRAVASVYEPGSTMKILTLASALEDGVISLEEQVDCEGGKYRVGGRVIGDGDHAFGVLGLGDIMKHSSNVCTAKIGLRMGSVRLHKWIRNFGFGQKTGVDLPGEARGLVREPSEWRTIALANIAFGQGLAVTPLQIASMAATIANGGQRVVPRVVRSVVDKAGQPREHEPSSSTHVLSRKTASRIRDLMVRVTEPDGTGALAAIPGFEVAGKTGTAQKVDPVTGRYSHDLFVASFVGFVPADRPEVVVFVLIDEPQKSIYGGAVAAPAFRLIATKALSARGVFPVDPAARDAFLASYREGSLSIESTGPMDTVASKDELSPAPSIESSLSSEARALLGLAPQAESSAKTNGPVAVPGKMPDFSALPLEDAVRLSREARCDLVLRGTGAVVKQVPSAGTSFSAGARCELVLAPRG
jgi:cell division protein FtsI (penicillin-binding protein 3)